MVAMPGNNYASDVPQLRHIVLDCHHLPPTEYIRLPINLSGLDLFSDMAYFSLSMLCRWVGIRINLGTLGFFEGKAQQGCLNHPPIRHD